MKTISFVLISLSAIAGMMATTRAAMAFSHRDQWVPEFKSSKPRKAIKKFKNDGDEAAVRHTHRVNKAQKDDESNDANELPEWADDAF